MVFTDNTNKILQYISNALHNSVLRSPTIVEQMKNIN